MSCDWESASTYSTLFDTFVSSCESSEWEVDEDDQFEDCVAMSGSTTEVVMGTTPKMGRRSMALADIDPKYVSQSGIWEASEVETTRGSIRIQHLTAVSTVSRPLSTTSGCTFHAHHSSVPTGSGMGGSRFPKLEDCAHFHYDVVDLPHLKFGIREDQVHRCLTTSCTGGGGGGTSSSEEPADDKDKYSNFSIEILSGGQCWVFRRTVGNWIKLDEQLHRCVWDRKFSRLEDLENRWKSQEFSGSESRDVIAKYLERLTVLPTNQITCGTVLSWFEIDNRGRHIISSDDAALNTPAVAAALATKSYTAQASDELSFRIGEMISVIDMPPPEESIWLRGKLTRESHELGINFEVGFFPREFVEIIGEKVKFHSGTVPLPTTRRLARVSVTSTTSTASPIPDKPVLRKHGKIISFFRSMMSRPEKRVLQQKGILRERVFNCDLAEHLLNTGSEIPVILKTCAHFIEIHGISDGIYRVSGSLRNTQRLRRLFDADEVPNLAEDEGIRQDVHAVSSVLKQYFRELPNPLCTYQLYEKFVHAISPPSNKERFDNIKEVIKELPPPHYRTLEYLMLHLSKMTVYSEVTGMTAQNMAIVWAPNLIRCRDLEGGSAAEFKGVSNHVIVTEFVIRYAERFFGKDKSPLPSSSENTRGLGRPESLLLSSASPMKLMSLEAAKQKLSQSRNYIEVGGGPSSLPPVYHTVIDTSKRRGGSKSKGAMGTAGGWKNFFSRNRSFSKGQRKPVTPDIRIVMNTAMNVKDGSVPGSGHKLRPVRSEESLIIYAPFSPTEPLRPLENTLEVDEPGDCEEIQQSTSSPASPILDAYTMTLNTSHLDELLPESEQQIQTTENPKTHNRSISHDSYFESQMKRLGMVPIEIHEEEGEMTSKISLAVSSSLDEDVQKDRSSGVYGDCDSNSSQLTRNRSSFSSVSVCPTPSTSTLSLRPSYLPMLESPSSDSSSQPFHSVCLQVKGQSNSNPNSPMIRPKAKPRLSKLKDCQVQTSVTAVNDVGISTNMDEEPVSVSCSATQCHSIQVSESFRNRKSCESLDFYHYPTFNESEKDEVGRDLCYELDRNSSVDESSTDTTPGVDPYSVTNIVYSPLMNELSTPTPTPTSPSSTTGTADPCSVEEAIEPCQFSEQTVSMDRDEESTTLPPPASFADVQHYENLETFRQFHFQDVSISGIVEFPESTVGTVALLQGKIDQEAVPSFINAETKEDYEILTSEAESIPCDSMEPSASATFETVTIENISIMGIDPATPTLKLRLNQSSEPLTDNSSSSPTEDSAYSDELDQDTENMTYFEMDSKSTRSQEGVEPDCLTAVSDPSPVSERREILNLDNPLPLHSNTDKTKSLEVKKSSLKVMNRCNSAPLSDTGRLVSLGESKGQNANISVEEPTTEIGSRKVTRTTSMVREQQKLLMCKRLSEPTLNLPKGQLEKGSWSHADAKRLTHRKQSVRELLNKFESTSSDQPTSLSPCPSPTRTSPLNHCNGNVSKGLKLSTSDGSAESNSCLRDRNNTRYHQHHRFSLGDILISDGLNSGTDKLSVETSGISTMTRSDTYPELRNEATKENESNSIEYADKRTIIPEKIVHLFEVANTTVDNSDPNTRERIEKYKNNRRLFLREKYSGLSTDQSESISASSSLRSSSSSTSSSSSSKPGVDRESCSSIESVFGQSLDRSSSLLDSPRKRALSEDASSIHHFQNQFKAFKSEGESNTLSINLPPIDKVGLPRPPPSSNIKKIPEESKNEKKGEQSHVPLGSNNSRLNIRSCPPGSIISLTTTMATSEVPMKCHWASTPSISRTPLVPTSSSLESGKKIKDIAAFFERKQF